MRNTLPSQGHRRLERRPATERRKTFRQISRPVADPGRRLPRRLRTQDTTFLRARYRRLARRIGKLKALVAIQHSILTAVWHVLSENTDYHDLGGDYHAKRDPQRALRRITRDANRLGYTVRFDPIQAA